MEPLILFIVFFMISGLISSAAKQGKGRKPGSPWNPPPGLPPLEELFRRPLPKKTEVSRRPVQLEAAEYSDIDKNKQQELAEASGKEGEWGDEGRPSMALAEPKPPASGELQETLQPPVFPAAFSEADLAKGIILAEVLAKPRALRPYRGPRG